MSEEEQQFSVQKIYLKDVSFESPNSPQSFTGGNEWQPQINVNVNSSHSSMGENLYEVILDVTVTAKQDEKTIFLAEVKQAGIFMMAGFADENKGGMLGAYCPETLFPYAREAISELIGKGGFPQLLLSPVNFNALYQQQLQQAGEQPDQGAAH